MRCLSRCINFPVLFLFLLLNSSAIAQSINLEKRISINFKSQSLQSVLKYIEKEADVSFTYSNLKINTEQKVTIIARNQTLNNVLHELFSRINISFDVIEKQIVLTPEIVVVNQDQITQEIKSKKVTVYGYLKDKQTGEALINATIFVNGTLMGTVTNEYGYYALTIPEGTYTLVYSYLGYNKLFENLHLTKDVLLNKELDANEVSLDLVIVTEKSGRDILENNVLKNTTFDSRKFARNAGISGEADLVKTIKGVAGVNFYGDGSVYFYTRGGNRDQNIIFIDEAPVFNPAHLLGFISAISPEIINNIKFYKSDFPIKYGGVLSSITDIYTKEGNSNKFGFGVVHSPFASTFSFEGPFKKNKSSYILTLRSSNINWLIRQLYSGSEARFYDFHTKTNFRLGTRNRIFFTLYTSSDALSLKENLQEERSLSWQNLTGTLRWNHLFSDKLFSNLSIIASNYEYYLYTNADKSDYWNSRIGSIQFKYDFTQFLKHGNTIRFGTNINVFSFNPGNLNFEHSASSLSPGNVIEYISYLGNDWRLWKKLRISYNLRAIAWNNYGQAVVYTYNHISNSLDTLRFDDEKMKTTFNFEPRLSILFAANRFNLIKFSYDKNTQNIHLISNSTSPFIGLDTWLPTGINLQTQVSRQMVLSYNIKLSELEFYINLFNRKLYNQIDYSDHTNIINNSLIELEIKNGEINSQGIELGIIKAHGNLNFEISYTFSNTVRKTPEINNNREYFAVYHKPHNFNFQVNYSFASRLTSCLSWVYASGSRYSKPQGFYYYQNYAVPIYSEKNNAKLPDYHRLDLSLTYRLNRNENSRFKHNVSLSVFNVYGRKNIVSINYNKTETESGNFVVPANYLYENQLTATQLWFAGIVPVLTYTVKL